MKQNRQDGRERRVWETGTSGEAAFPAGWEGAGVRPGVAWRAFMLAALSVVATSILAYVRIPLPFTPVPLTGQTFGVMLTGILLGSRLGGSSMFAYGLIGLFGLPVFAGGGAGFAHLLGPTGGYLWGSVAGTYVAGLVVDGAVRRGEGLTYGRALLAAIVGGIVAVYGIGVVHLAIVTGMGWREALVSGVLPFLPGDFLKATAAAAAAVRLAPVVRRTLR